MNEIAQFMDNEVGEGISSKWSDTVNQQRKVIENLDLSLSGLLLKDIENKKITFQEYGLQLSRAHKKEMDDLVLNGSNNFNESSKESLLAAQRLEEEHQVDFEDYLKDFLDKIS